MPSFLSSVFPIAQISTSPTYLGHWLVSAACVLGMLYMIAKGVFGALAFFRRKPSIDAEFATRVDLREERKERTEADNKIETKQDKNFSELRSDIGGVHRRLDRIYKTGEE